MAEDDMESQILPIISDFDDQNMDKFVEGLDSLEKILTSMLPHIENQRNTVVKSGKIGKFLKLQDNFQFNITQHLVKCNDLIYENIDDISTELIIRYTRSLQGILLIHPSSRTIFNSNIQMTKVLKFIELDNSKYPFEINISFISLLLHILLKDLKNFRTFETCNGCSIIIKKLNLSDFQLKNPSKNSKSDQQVLNFKIIEFLIFYLNEEDKFDFPDKKTVKQKSDFFRKDFPGIDNLIESLNDLKNI
ncbi:hypothetical protein CLIB1444_02S09472 [[Candida] jaroonii]|uniref:Uncharacterized protein n=1 Tax=[Candida] jaroonii TaxID=467808 RepID=A0ACA9Y3D3_9ASCO|nr:hypothetical protein CLIB1444_02S09472 [[Candida] jaroonii]